VIRAKGGNYKEKRNLQIVCHDANTALPLYDDYDIIEQPVDLNQLGDHYAQQAATFIESASKSGKPFLLYVAFAHMHVPMSHAPR